MSPAKDRKGQRIRELIELLQQRLPASEATKAAHFVERYFASVAPEDVLAVAVDAQLASVTSLWRFGKVRQVGEAKIRVFNPELAEHGWQSEHTVVEIVNDDMPFLVSSVTGALNRRGRALHLVGHPIVRTRRDDQGRRIEWFDDDAEEGLAESYIHVEFDQLTNAATLDQIARELERVLADVRSAVDDFDAMAGKVDEALIELAQSSQIFSPSEAEEATSFLTWLKQHFLFLGYREYDLVEEDGETYQRLDLESGLGILKTVSEASLERSRRPLSPDAAAHAREPVPLFLTKTYNRSKVHRQVHMDYIGVRRFDEAGRVYRERRFIGLFTSEVYDEGVRRIPLVSHRVARVAERAGFSPGSHDSRVLHHIFEALPRDEMFQMTDDELYELSVGILHLQERQRLALFVRRDPFERFVSCLVYVPRDRYNTELREEMAQCLAGAFNGRLRAFDVRSGDLPLARVLFTIRTQPGKVPECDVEALQKELEGASLTWQDRLRSHLVETHGEEEGLTLFARCGSSFPAAYRDRFDADTARQDLDHLEQVLASGELRMSLYRLPAMAANEMRFKIYAAGRWLLSDILPMFENMGLKVVAEEPYEIRLSGEESSVWLLDFELVTADGFEVDLEADGGRFREAFARLWNGEVENDGFNRLVLAAGLGWRDIIVLRAYCKYLRQIRIPFSQQYMEETLVRNPEPTRLLVDLFHARFDPARGALGKEQAVELRGRLRRALGRVTVLDQDRILRRFVNLIRSTLRTNFFQLGDDGEAKDYLALKLDSRSVLKLQEPRPAFEIFVYSPSVEAVHLRGGRVARGGVRWSDRREDFRTEILGLVKAQLVKNAVIVPVGAKGGFVVKGSNEPTPEDGVEAYRTMIRALLDVTDNLVQGEVVPPSQVVRHDGDDPYLVVAADKGTARFSDVANGIALERGFWLGDAFASGGSAGYDHKAMGITARGAWESVKRHFRELGRDIQSEDFTVVGVGDMSGDVFGNGMLLSRHIRLQGAFNHLHIFVDPSPDAATSFAERQRLFALPRSSWGDYDRALLSPGGAIYERSAKSVELTPEIRSLVGLERSSVTPDELIQALLRCAADLLWFGGIGTYVKAQGETHGAADDRVNDGLRINASEVRCQVVGEGANLGLTQRARIELGAAGVRLNTDAIDNSAGVGTSDHEVNIKILLADVATRGDLDGEQRNALLEAMTEEVADLVLRDNYLQSQAITVEQARGPRALEAQEGALRQLEQVGLLDREIELLPDDAELDRRRAAGEALTRPELAVLLAYAKIFLYREVLLSELPDDPAMAADLADYFPRPLREPYGDEIQSHRLRREIIATDLANSLVNRVGPTFVSRMMSETGASAPEVAKAFVVVRDAFDLRSLWSAIEALDLAVPAAVQLARLREVGALLESTVLWLLRRNPHGLGALAGRIDEIRPQAAELLGAGSDLLPPALREGADERCRELVAEGLPEPLAQRIAGLRVVAAACELVAIASDAEVPILEAGRAYFELGARLGLDWLRRRAAALGEEDPWQKAAAEALVQDLQAHQGMITRRILTTGADGETWLAERRPQVRRFDELLGRLREAPEVEAAMMTVASHHLRLLAES
ncbi:MAG: NAD-glutamate dehydrogenase [Acidobacteriota bacterium]